MQHAQRQSKCEVTTRILNISGLKIDISEYKKQNLYINEKSFLLVASSRLLKAKSTNSYDKRYKEAN